MTNTDQTSATEVPWTNDNTINEALAIGADLMDSAAAGKELKPMEAIVAAAAETYFEAVKAGEAALIEETKEKLVREFVSANAALKIIAEIASPKQLSPVEAELAAAAAAVITEPVNWNRIDFDIDKEIWDHITANFWLDTRIPISGDLQSWSRLTDAERLATVHVFAGLTTLDTIQATVGAISLIPDAYSQHEEAVYTYIAMQESVHAKSYSSIFATLCSTEESDAAFQWAKDNPYIQKKAEIVLKYYNGNDSLKRRIASTLLESFLFYSGFYLPFYWASRAKLTNTADLIRLIVQDEAVHGFYIGNRYQHGLSMETEERKEELQEFTEDLLMELYDNEIRYTQDIYDELGLTEDVTAFLRYNANKALNNLGYEALFPVESTQANPAILASLALGSETHDFFSGAGSAYMMAKHKPTNDVDWDFGRYGYKDSFIKVDHRPSAADLLPDWTIVEPEMEELLNEVKTRLEDQHGFTF